MGELARFKGLTVDIYWFDDDQHSKPHVHAEYGNDKISIGIDGEVLAGSLPAKQLKQLKAWLTIYEDDLYEAWNKAVKGENPGKIKD
jgi:hypothetical protein